MMAAVLTLRGLGFMPLHGIILHVSSPRYRQLQYAVNPLDCGNKVI